jgi:hypothetical protein
VNISAAQLQSDLAILFRSVPLATFQQRLQHDYDLPRLTWKSICWQRDRGRTFAKRSYFFDISIAPECVHVLLQEHFVPSFNTLMTVSTSD